MALTRAAVLRVACHEPLEGLTAEMCPTTLVLGGGIAGLTAALELAEGGFPVVLVEKARPARRQPGARRPDRALPRLGPRPAARAHHARAREPQHHGDAALAAQDPVGLRRQLHRRDRQPTAASPRPSKLGNVVVATGYKEFDASRITHLRLRQAAQRHHLLRVRAHAARGPHRDQGRPAARSTSPSSTASARAARSSTATARASAA